MTYSSMSRRANEPQTAEADAAQLHDQVANPNTEFSRAVDVAARLDHRRLAALVVHLARKSLVASVGFEVMTHVATDRALEAEKLNANLKRRGTYIAPPKPQTPEEKTATWLRIKRAYAVGQARARVRRTAREGQ